MTAGPLPEAWTGLPRAVRDAVLGKLLARRLSLEGAAAEPAPIRADRSRPVPASLEQAYVLRQQRRFGGRVAWTMAAPPVVLDPVDVEAARRAVERLARRHDVLHTTLRQEGGRFLQFLDPDAPAPLTLTKLPLAATLTGVEAWVRRRYEAMLAEPFDAESGPLWRAELVSRGGRGGLLLTFCSLVADGESLHLIDADFRALYAAELTGGADEHGPPPVEFDYADHAAAQDDLLRTGRFDGSLSWWRERLAGGPPAAWTDGRDGVAPARLYEQALAPVTGRALDAYAAAHRTTPPVVLLTEFMACLRQLDDGDDIWVASATVARDRPETRAMVGTFARLVPLRLSWPATADPLGAVGATLLEAMDREPVPHLLLQEMLETAHPDAPSAFRYIFNHRVVGDGTEGGDAADLPFQAGPKHAEAHREEDVLLMVLQSGEGRRLHWYLRTDRFDSDAAERLLVAFHTALRRRIGAEEPAQEA